MHPWTAFALWLIGGGGMSTQPTHLPDVYHAPVRTIADVEAELILSAVNVAHERAAYARKWPSRITANLADETLTYVRRHNALIDEWAWWRYDDAPTITRTGGVNHG